jgi:hypothetical protein
MNREGDDLNIRYVTDIDSIRQQHLTVKAYLLDKEWYKLVDCLEEVSNFWSYGRDWATMPAYNTYMPTRTHLMDKPDMLDGEKDDLG